MQMRTVFIIAAKDLLLAWRDKLGFFWWMVSFPLLIAVLVGQIFASVLGGPAKATTLAVIDRANSPQSIEFTQVLDKAGMVKATPMTVVQAHDAVRRGKVAAFIELPETFHISPGILFGDTLPLSLGVDPSRRSETMYIEAALYDGAMTQLRNAWLDPSRRPDLIDAWARDRHGNLSTLERSSIDMAMKAMDRLLGGNKPAAQPTTMPARQHIRLIPVAETEIRPRTPFEVCFPIGILWGLLGLAAEFAISNARERETGTLLRLRAAPVWRGHMLLGNGLAAFVACLGVIIMLLIVGRVAFSIRLQNPVVLAMAVTCTATCFVGVTMLLSVIGKTEAAVGGGAWAFLLVMAMLGGGMVPQMFLPTWMDVAGNVSFVKWAIRSLEGGIWREFTVFEALTPCAILLLEGGICGAIGLALGARAER
jgi:ABC-2 type transport system permease protein